MNKTLIIFNSCLNRTKQRAICLSIIHNFVVRWLFISHLAFKWMYLTTCLYVSVFFAFLHPSLANSDLRLISNCNLIVAWWWYCFFSYFVICIFVLNDDVYVPFYFWSLHFFSIKICDFVHSVVVAILEHEDGFSWFTVIPYFFIVK